MKEDIICLTFQMYFGVKENLYNLIEINMEPDTFQWQ